jgi:hypothetical protein
MASLADALSGHARLGLDTTVFIYHLEQHPRYFPLTRALLSGIEVGRWTACTSVVTLMELTVRPCLQRSGRQFYGGGGWRRL